MQSSEHRPSRVRAPMLVAAIIALHGVAVGTFLFIQGCGTTSHKTANVEPPPAPMMPPKNQPAGTAAAAQPALQPPVAIEAGSRHRRTVGEPDVHCPEWRLAFQDRGEERRERARDCAAADRPGWAT